jgi:hypothetical protein
MIAAHNWYEGGGKKAEDGGGKAAREKADAMLKRG